MTAPNTGCEAAEQRIQELEAKLARVETVLSRLWEHHPVRKDIIAALADHE